MIKRWLKNIRIDIALKLLGNEPLITCHSSYVSENMTKKEMAVAKRETLKRFKDLLLKHCDVVAYTIYGHTIVQASFFINKIDRKEKDNEKNNKKN